MPFNIDTTDREVYDFSILPQLSLEGGKEIKALDILDKDGEVVACDSKHYMLHQHSDTADTIVKALVVKAWEKIGDKEKAEEVEDKMTPVEKGDIPGNLIITMDETHLCFIKALREKILTALKKNEDRLYRERPGLDATEIAERTFLNAKEQQEYIQGAKGAPDHLILSWDRDLVELTVEIKFSEELVKEEEEEEGEVIVPMKPKYEGEDWHEVGRYPTYTDLNLIDSVGVLYTGRAHQLLIQLVDWYPTEFTDITGRPRGPKYTDAKISYTTKEGKLLTCLMQRTPSYWKLKETSINDIENYKEILKERNYLPGELSYLIEAHVRHVIKHCDMPIRDWGRDDTGLDNIWLASGRLILGDPFHEKIYYPEDGIGGEEDDEIPILRGRAISIDRIARGDWQSKVTYSPDIGTPINIVLAHEQYYDDFMHPVPRTQQLKLKVHVKLHNIFMVADHDSLNTRWGTKDEFTPILEAFTSRKFIRPYKCNYLGSGIGVATHYDKEMVREVFLYEATEGNRKGQIVSLICHL